MLRCYFSSQVRNEGGVLFAGLAKKAWLGAHEEAAEAAYELPWEELHSGRWQSVSLVWRDGFSLCCLSLPSCHHRGNRPVQALEVLDLGVIMGAQDFVRKLTLNSTALGLGTDKGLNKLNAVYQGSHEQVASPDVLLREKEGQVLHAVSRTLFDGVLVWIAFLYLG